MSRIQGWNSFCSKSVGSYCYSIEGSYCYSIEGLRTHKPLLSSQPERCEAKWKLEFFRSASTNWVSAVCQALYAWMTSIKGSQEGHFTLSATGVWFPLLSRWSVYTGSMDDWVENLEPHCLVSNLADNRFRTRTQVVYVLVQYESETQRKQDVLSFFTSS